MIEVCPSAGWITDLAARLQIELQVANPSHEGWRWRSVKKKTDRVDALKLARLSAVNQLPMVAGLHLGRPSCRTLHTAALGSLPQRRPILRGAEAGNLE